ncbi:MAG TPA: helix-turn-helix domain-containing protein [Thermomicrobiales bacterium]|nr:helix-turn-helix domain-containing protein [Thermomicrobiales bacterium]
MELLTIQESARILKVNPITVRRHIAAGRLAAVRVGARVRVPREALEQFAAPVEPGEAIGGRAFTEDDPLWNIVGAGHSAGPDDVSEHKQRYLAEARRQRETGA